MLDAEPVVYLSSASRNTSCAPITESRSLTGPRLLQPAGYTGTTLQLHRELAIAVKVSTTTEAHERHYWHIGAGMPSPDNVGVKL